MSAASWHVITGEYPPQRGGVADYAERVATGLAAAGCSVHVWCPACTDPAERPVGIEVHRLNGRFGWRSLRRMGRAIDRVGGPRRLLVQYAPNALGMRGLNVPFCLWLLHRSRYTSDEIRVMFHEPFFYFAWQRPQRNLLACVHRLMAVLLLAASHTAYLSSQAWTRHLRAYAWWGRPVFTWLPVPATVPHHPDAERVERIRHRLGRGHPEARIIGHFGTCGEPIGRQLAPALVELLGRHPHAVVLCLGLDGEAFVGEFNDAQPALRGRVVAPGFLSSVETSLHLQACDLAIQPYPDGVTSRRTSVMACLVNGVPVITTRGVLTEPLWEHDAVAMVPAGDVPSLVDAASNALEDCSYRRSLGERGRRFYLAHFSLAHAIRILRSEGDGSCSRPQSRGGTGAAPVPRAPAGIR